LPFIVLGYCETCDNDGTLVGLYNESDKSEKLTERGSRISGRQEYVTFIKTPDLSAIESWYYLKPELRYIAVLGSGTTAKKSFDTEFKPTREDAKNGY